MRWLGQSIGWNAVECMAHNQPSASILGLEWLLYPFRACGGSGGAPARRHFCELTNAWIGLEHATKADELHVCGFKRGAAEELPVAVAIVMDLAHRLRALHGLPRGEHRRIGRQVERPSAKSMRMTHARSNPGLCHGAASA